MEKSFFNERHRELYGKFSDKKEKYLRVLGGASEKNAESFDLKEYIITLSKKVPDYTSRDSLLSELALNYMEGNSIYEKMKLEDRPFYCRVFDNINSKERAPLRGTEDDPVYRALIELESRINKIHDEQFVPFEGFSKNGDEESLEAENMGKYCFELDSKENFIRELIGYLVRRVPRFDSSWVEDVYLTESRYNFLLENLVKSNDESKANFEKEFIGAIPTFSHEGFYFWPKE